MDADGFDSFQNAASDLSTNGFRFKSSSNTLVTIHQNDGNVGIGTTSPGVSSKRSMGSGDGRIEIDVDERAKDHAFR